MRLTHHTPPHPTPPHTRLSQICSLLHTLLAPGCNPLQAPGAAGMSPPPRRPRWARRRLAAAAAASRAACSLGTTPLQMMKRRRRRYAVQQRAHSQHVHTRPPLHTLSAPLVPLFVWLWHPSTAARLCAVSARALARNFAYAIHPAQLAWEHACAACAVPACLPACIAFGVCVCGFVWGVLPAPPTTTVGRPVWAAHGLKCAPLLAAIPEVCVQVADQEAGKGPAAPDRPHAGNTKAVRRRVCVCLGGGS